MKPRAWLWNGKVYDPKPATQSEDKVIPLYAIPENWKLVPNYPTDVMVQQGVAVTEDSNSKASIDSTVRSVIYEAIKVAPESPDESGMNLDFSSRNLDAGEDTKIENGKKSDST
jgi:hypothetical protein